MINWLIVYGLLVGAAIRVSQHGRLVVPASTLKQGRMGSGWPFRLAVIALVVVLPTPPSFYQECFAAQWAQAPWLVGGSVGVALVLYLLKEVTFETSAYPHRYQEGASSHMSRLNMKLTLGWYTAFWVWVLSNPVLPFGKCFIRVFLLGHDPSIVIPGA